MHRLDLNNLNQSSILNNSNSFEVQCNSDDIFAEAPTKDELGLSSVYFWFLVVCIEGTAISGPIVLVASY